jgi:mRNA-degrading endonuclease toxin of MazEF toxin-antitoxin module
MERRPVQRRTGGRPWLVLNDETHPFGDEQHMAVALSTSGHDAAIPVREGDWEAGGTPRRSYVLPWAIHSPQRADVTHRQGRLADTIVGRTVEQLLSYIDPGE